MAERLDKLETHTPNPNLPPTIRASTAAQAVKQELPVPSQIQVIADELLGPEFKIICKPDPSRPLYELTVLVPDQYSPYFQERTDIPNKENPALRIEWDYRTKIIPFGAGGDSAAREFFSRIRNNIFKEFQKRGLSLPSFLKG